MIATGVAGGPTGTRIIEQLTEEAILNDFVRIREESRTSTAVVDPTTGEQTEINERGPAVSEAELELFVDKLLYLAKGAAVCVFAGSLPRGVDAGLYARLIEEMRRLGVTTVLDSEGEPMRLAPAPGPTSSRPNELEAEELVGHEFADDEDRRTGVARDGRAGRPRGDHDPAPTAASALLRRRAGERALYRATLEPLEPRVAGRLGRRLPGRLRRRPLRRPHAEECLRFAVACGAESTQHFGAGVLDPREVERLLAEVASVEPARDAAQLPPSCGTLDGSASAASVGLSSAAEPRMPPWK